MDLSAELKELRKQLYTYRYKSLELERQLRTHCHAFSQSIESERQLNSARSEPDQAALVVPHHHAFQETLSSCISAFTNSLVMEIIASHLPVQDLLRCRLVCRLWAREMAQYLTKRSALVVAYEDCTEAKELLKKKRDGKFVNISTLCVLEISITSPIIAEVIQSFGATLSGLKLDDCNPEAEDLYKLLQAIPSLEVLSYKQTGIRRRICNGEASQVASRLDGLTAYSNAFRITSLKKLEWEELHPVRHLERVIHMFPRLEELELLCWSKPDVASLAGLRLETLKHLTISCDNNFSEDHFQALANLKLNLRKLTLHDLQPGSRKRMRGLKALLESVARTLCELNLNGNGRVSQEASSNLLVRNSTPFPIEFPSLQKLDIDCSLMTDLKMLDGMPQLKKLECKFQDWKGWWHLLNGNGLPKAHDHLLDLSLGSIDSGCLGRIAGCFNSVTKLDVAEDRVDDIAFRTISRSLPQLSHLRITPPTNDISRRKLQLTDSGITGLPLEVCTRLQAEPLSSQAGIADLRKHPFIGDLKSLYSLELACSEIDMTDVAVLHGIVELRRITTITLPKCKLTNASLDALGELPGLLVLELHKSCGVTPDAVAALRSKKKDLVFNLYSDLSTRIFS